MGNYKRSSGIVSTVIIAIFSIYLILLGVGVYFYDWVFKYNAIALGAILIIVGVVLMAKYFMNEEYKNPTNYGFSVGLMMILVGGFVILNTKAVVKYTPAYVGIIILFLGIVVLQHAFAMRFMESKSFAASLIFALLIIASAVVILLDLMSIASTMNIYFSILSVCCGILCLISMICIKVSAKNFAGRLNVKYERMMEEKPDTYDFSTVRPEPKTKKEIKQEEKDAKAAAKAAEKEAKAAQKEAKAAEKEAKKNKSDEAKADIKIVNSSDSQSDGSSSNSTENAVPESSASSAAESSDAKSADSMFEE